ncbi:RNA polymerase sigma-70 factor, ECF subfamily [Labilithrix luteola]|uniref:RNA polymerase sigma-70 factor, ECF subfamily n=2 Tax=Labilithrix luteola TaxID=1391654 RepID=A0A0K1PLX7_9BACT|nr:RNA polymerase sigma-70 factor, ECF subfamily [Labilithrix luteola]
MRTVGDGTEWLARFHAGERRVLEECYREHFARVVGVSARLVGPIDAETVAHEIFFRLLSSAEFRRGYQGGSLGSWLSQVATNAAIDNLRRRKREVPSENAPLEATPPVDELEQEVMAKVLVERFRRECLPPKWEGVFDARFLRQLPQRDAARELGIHRTTLVYQEARIRSLLERFLLDSESPK